MIKVPVVEQTLVKQFDFTSSFSNTIIYIFLLVMPTVEAMPGKQQVVAADANFRTPPVHSFFNYMCFLVAVSVHG